MRDLVAMFEDGGSEFEFEDDDPDVTIWKQVEAVIPWPYTQPVLLTVERRSVTDNCVKRAVEVLRGDR